MYSQKTEGWLKHGDFIFLDILCLHIAYVLAYMTRHGISNLYSDELYRNLAFVMTVVDFALLVINRTMKNVLKRGYYKEIEQTLKHVFLVMVTLSLYMFISQKGDEYSRLTFFVSAVYYTLIAYVARLIWKKLLLTKKTEDSAVALYFITTKDRAEYIIDRFRRENINHDRIQGLCILDADCIGQKISGIPVSSGENTVLKYLCDKWVDEIFVSLPESFPYPSRLITTLVEMGMVVHVEMEQPGIENWQHQVIEKMAGTTVRTISITMATPMQKFMKRALDIVGGLFGCILTGLLTLIIGPMIYIK